MFVLNLLHKVVQPTLACKLFRIQIDHCCLCRRILVTNYHISTYDLNEHKKSTIDYKHRTAEQVKKKKQLIEIWEGMTPFDLAKATNRPIKDVHSAMKIKEMKELNGIKDISFVAGLLNFRCRVITNPKWITQQSEIDYGPFKEGIKFMKRPPVVTIMGHVDHGKTTLLDALRKSELVKQEHGGITQHIGAFVVSLNDKSKADDKVTFLDTPGHAAFHAMRERGAKATDIVVLVVAADDGVMDQTIESIKFANNAHVPIIVAINKIDKVPNFNKSLEIAKRGLMAQNIIFEEDGGETQAVRISALKGIGLDQLKESILVLAETLELKAYVDGYVQGVVLESSVNPKRGKQASILVQQGTMKKGDILWAGEGSWAKVRSMFDEWGNTMEKCPPGFPVQVIGWKDEHLPQAGDFVRQIENEKRAKMILSEIEKRELLAKFEEAEQESAARLEEHLKTYKPELEARRAAGIRYKRKKQIGPREKMIQPENDDRLNIIFKSDVNGSLEVFLDIIESYPNDNSPVKVNLIDFDVGSIIENDIEMASCFKNTIIYTFNIGLSSPKIASMAKEHNVKIKMFNVIYHLVDDLKAEISERLPLLDEEHFVGEGVVLQEFLINEKKKKVPVAGSKCSKGIFRRENCFYKVIRGEEMVQKDLKISSMKHLKDEVKEIRKDFECGLRFEGIEGTDGFRFQSMDRLICYEIKKVKQKTKWSPPGF